MKQTNNTALVEAIKNLDNILILFVEVTNRIKTIHDLLQPLKNTQNTYLKDALVMVLGILRRHKGKVFSRQQVIALRNVMVVLSGETFEEKEATLIDKMLLDAGLDFIPHLPENNNK